MNTLEFYRVGEHEHLRDEEGESMKLRHFGKPKGLYVYVDILWGRFVRARACVC